MAVSNLNYISLETEDENLQASHSDVYKNLDTNKILPTAEEVTSELSISEPPYYPSKENNKSEDVTDSLCPSDKFSQECSQLLENCSIGSANNDYVLQPSNVPVFNVVNNVSNDDGNYKFQPSNRPVEKDILPTNNLCSQNRANTKLIQHQPIYGSLKRTASDASSCTRSNADDELAEIMYDFKNNVLSIREVEVLVEKWKHRNDVQQSFREKQDQIEQLRKEYECIQDHIKRKLKRETPFEKIKKLFSRHKSTGPLSDKHSCADSALDETKSSINTNSSAKCSTHRPISSLSLQSVSSSASSGRLSTGSNCSGTSLGDSGTHSDHEERRFGCRLGSPGSLMDNYLVPPTPRPVLTPNSTPGDERHQIVFPSPMSPCQRVNPVPTSPVASSEHYQMFPSNIPVYTSQNLSSSHNTNYLNTIAEAKEHETQYQNCVTLQPIKVNECSNIIYGKLTKATPSCSSFKPKQVAVPQAAKIEVQAEVYQNVKENLEQTQDIDQKEEQICIENQNSPHQKEVETNSENDNDHNYMNC